MKIYLGVELGSTRIKAAIVDAAGDCLAAGESAWENRMLDKGVWTYDLADARQGLAAAYAACADAYAARFGARPTRFDAMGVSAMMHGYLAFDGEMRQLAPFRTWRSTNAARAGAELSAAFNFTVPMRWSVAQLYQSVLDGEEHVRRIAFLTTLAGYVHYLLTGSKVIGLNDASGMFPIDFEKKSYDARMVAIFKERTGLDVTQLFPRPLAAGEPAGTLTAEGARLLDPSGALLPGVPMCPPEGDAGTGMMATGAFRPGTGSVSVGTSVFAMTVLRAPLHKPSPFLDVVATPSGDPVAMVHCNNGCGELDKWVNLFGGDYEALLTEAVEKGEPDCGGVVATNWISAEPIMGVDRPFPHITHSPNAHLTRANIILAELKAVFASLVAGMKTLKDEGLMPDSLTGHGGLFKTKGVAAKVLSDMLHIPVMARQTAGEGGAWGMAILAAALAGCAAPQAADVAAPHVIGRLADAPGLYERNPLFKAAFEFANGNDLASMPVGRYDIAGDDCYAMIQTPMLKPADEGRFEAHRNYIDIQIPIDGDETYGLCETPDAVLASANWGKGDIIFFDAPMRTVTVRPGGFAVFFPIKGAHAPCLTEASPCARKKLVIKVKANRKGK